MSHHDDEDLNSSSNETFERVLTGFLSRRNMLKGGAATASALLFGTALTACGGNDYEPPAVPAPVDPAPTPVLRLNFNAVAKSLADVLTIPAGYTASVLYALGDPTFASTPAYSNAGTDTGVSFAGRAGDHHDGMEYFGLGADGKWSPTASTRGLLCMNHENITQLFLHAAGPTGASSTRSVADEVVKEINCHGISVIEVTRAGAAVTVKRDSAFNRRLTPNSPMKLSGPAAGTAQLRTVYSPAGTDCRGTINNCATGHTPWGTFLTCEENWAGYFHRNLGDDTVRGGATSKAVRAFARYGVGQDSATTVSGSYRWSSATAAPGDTTFRRWDASQSGALPDGTDDFRNEPNTFGYIVEIDPFNAASVPKKRTAMGRLAHEAAAYGAPVVGRPLAFYMGDDSRGEYIYKFVTKQNWVAEDANGGAAMGDKYLDEGTLYAAKFNENGTGTWLPLTMANPAISGYTTYAFADQADICINARLAADAAGATKMDRPEWSAVNPKNGDVYFTLTNNNAAGRTVANADAANPRSYADPKGGRGNPNGHIIRLHETDNQSAATTFTWDIYLFGARAVADATNVNVSGLTDANDFSSPDGIWFDNRGLCWIQTDDGAYTDVTNCMMLAALPGNVGDGARKVIINSDGTTQRSVETSIAKGPTDTTLRRFLVGPKGCEITGIASTPDYKTLFVNIQHPGEETTLAQLQASTPQSTWPTSTAGARPRSATVVIVRTDGAEIGAQLGT
ncbi:MAG: PhoX family phosphatase [Steroidobacteraceae bacterium]